MSERNHEGGRTGAADAPNVLFVITDDHTTQAIGAYLGDDGPETIPTHLADDVATPNIDRIGEEGVRFDNAFCTNSLCAPARATVLTGQYSHRNGVTVNHKALDDTRWAFPRTLQEAGYRTGVIGKWHLRSGYDDAVGSPPGFDHYEVLAGQGAHWDPTLHTSGGRSEYEGYTPDVLADRCTAWIEEASADEPFFLMAGLKATHAPWIPREDDLDAIADTVPEPETLHDGYETREGGPLPGALKIGRQLYEDVMDVPERPLDPIPDGLSERAEREWIYQRFVRRYLATVRGVDRSVGRLLDALETNGLREDTIVVYTADHGFFLGEHGLVDKRHMYEPALRIPLLVRWPGRTEPGSVQRALAANIDVAPTILDAAGCECPEQVQGRSLSPLLGGDVPDDWREAVYYRYYSENWGGVPQEGIRTSEHKCINFHTLEHREYYDLVDDPTEVRNLGATTGRESLQARLDDQLATSRAAYDIPPPDGASEP